jgi:hypothetical protein
VSFIGAKTLPLSDLSGKRAQSALVIPYNGNPVMLSEGNISDFISQRPEEQSEILRHAQNDNDA